MAPACVNGPVGLESFTIGDGGMSYSASNPDHVIVKTGQALLEADVRLKQTLSDRTISPIEGAFRAKRIMSLADKLAASALEGVVDLGPAAAAQLRAMAQTCWYTADEISDEEMGPSRAALWHDLGQALYDASHRLLALVEGMEDGSAR